MHIHNVPRHFDVLVVGAGSTGAVMASRLSEDAGRSVLLLEAGPHALADRTMAEAVLNARQPAVVPGLTWKLRCAIKGDSGAGARSAATFFDYEAGKLVGGSSAVNAVQALRGAPADYDEWAATCGDEWSWSSVLQYFRKLEDDPLGPDALHGSGGPMPIRREGKQALTPLQAGLWEACLAHGFAETGDHNDPATTGVGMIPKNVVDGVRMSTASTYLAPACRRANLTVIADAQVHRLRWKGEACCEGVEAEVDGELHTFLADEVILCAGAVHTPTLLMRSGIGSPAELQRCGLRTRVPLRGVGENLMDHPVVGIWGTPKPEACTLGEPLRQTLLRFSSGLSGQANDMHICLMAGLDAAAMFPRLQTTCTSPTIAGITVCFTKSISRGHVRLSAADPHAKPQVLINCLGDRSDLPPLKEGLRLAWQLLQGSGLRSRFEHILAWTDGMLNSNLALEQAISSFVRPSAHLCGTARMGPSCDTGAVVDSSGRVHGTQGLRVADASVMPRIPSAPTHLTSLMVAEKFAAGVTACKNSNHVQ